MKNLNAGNQMENRLQLADLKAAPYNPRKIKARAASGLAYSMSSFGDLGGIVWNSRTGNLVCGHQRVDQGRKAGATVVDGALVLPNGERFPIRVVDWSIGKERAANVAANNPHIAGDFDGALDAVIKEIEREIPKEDFEALCLVELAGSIPFLPDNNKDIDEQALSKTKMECPSCGFKW